MTHSRTRFLMSRRTCLFRNTCSSRNPIARTHSMMALPTPPSGSGGGGEHGQAATSLAKATALPQFTSPVTCARRKS
jgi:hypothetical protein